VINGKDSKLQFGEVNVTSEFIVWFAFGFWLCLLGLGQPILSLYSMVAKEKKAIKLVSFLYNFLVCGACFVWIIAGSVIRWNNEGQICTGKYIKALDPGYHFQKTGILTSSGELMDIVLISFWMLIGITCILAIMSLAFRQYKIKKTEEYSLR
jgi:hypothetical protein